MKKLKDIDLYKVGDSIQMVGTIFADDAHMYLCLFPGDRGNPEDAEGNDVVAFHPHSGGVLWMESLDMDRADWDTFLRQTDLMETEVITKASDGTLAKVILRKTQRQIDSDIQWRVFKRDGYSCRYCGNNNAPLTVDHLVCWESGGPSTEANMVASCKKCNKTRSNLSYEEWLQHPHYLRVSQNISPEARAQNQALVPTLAGIPRLVHKRSR